MSVIAALLLFLAAVTAFIAGAQTPKPRFNPNSVHPHHLATPTPFDWKHANHPYTEPATPTPVVTPAPPDLSKPCYWHDPGLTVQKCYGDHVDTIDGVAKGVVHCPDPPFSKAKDLQPSGGEWERDHKNVLVCCESGYRVSMNNTAPFEITCIKD
jgi:hypothetical protein